MSDSGGSTIQTRSAWAFWLGVLGWSLLTCWMNAPRLHHSLWNDEEDTARSFVVGQWKTEPDGKFAVRELPWSETLFAYRRPNNHVFFSALARVSHSRAPAPTEAHHAIYSEMHLRIIPWMAGMACLVLTAILGRILGGNGLGLIAMVLLSLHPYFTRYTTEARGYALIFAFALLQWFCAVKGASDGKWRWWMGFALGGLCSMWTWPMALYLVAPANAAAIILIATSNRPRSDRWTIAGRWFLCNAVAALTFLQFFLPNLTQMQQVIQKHLIKGTTMGWGEARDLATTLLTGSPWSNLDPKNPLFHSWSRVAETQPLLTALGILAILTLVLAGVVRAMRDRVSRTLLMAWVTPVFLILLHGKFTGSVLLPWYFAPAVPGLAFLMSFGVLAFMDWMKKVPLAAPTLAVVCCGVFFAMTFQRNQLLRTHPLDPNREAALLTRPVLNPWHPEFTHVPVAGFHMQLDPYVAGMEVVSTTEQLHNFKTTSLKRTSECFVIVGNTSEALQANPEVMSVLNNPKEWKHIGTLWGTEPGLSRSVFSSRERAVSPPE